MATAPLGGTAGERAPAAGPGNAASGAGAPSLVTKATGVVAGAVPDRAFASVIAYAHLRFEPVLRHVKSFVGPHQTALDVGAWYGPWTWWLSRTARQVVTVEANPEMAAFVARTARANVEVIAKAAAESAGTAQLWLPAGGRGTEGRASLTPQGEGRTIPVETIRLDSLDVTDLGVIKIDVEGHELAALRGAEGLVERFRPTLVVEIEDARASAAPILELLDGWGYAGSYLQDGVWRPLDGFDIAGYQRAMAGQLGGSYLSLVVSGAGKSHVNTIVFRPR